jgi:hypothetical protein
MLIIIIVYKRKQERKKSNAFFSWKRVSKRRHTLFGVVQKQTLGSEPPHMAPLDYIAIRLMRFVQHQSARVFGGLLVGGVYQVDQNTI